MPTGTSGMKPVARATINLTLDLLIVVGTHPRKARESCVREMARRGRDIARTGSVHSQPKQQGSDKEKAETLLNIHKQYIGLYSRIAKRMGVEASYVSRVANGEHHLNE